jgi:uncharacterized protein
VAVKETDLAIYAERNLEKEALDSVLRHRGYLEAYIERYPEFAEILTPWRSPGPAAEIVRDMANASALAGVGPMAAVAGAVAERVGRDLLAYSSEVVVENGGDVFIKTSRPATVGIFAGNSPLSLKIGVRIDTGGKPAGVCTSSGTVGHSLSKGRADAVCVIAESCALADAVATAAGNLVSSPSDIAQGVEAAKRIQGVRAVVVIVKDRIGAWGDVELASLREKC